MRKKKNKIKKLIFLNYNDALELFKFKKRTKVSKAEKFISQPDDSGQLFDNLIKLETVSEILGVAPNDNS